MKPAHAVIAAMLVAGTVLPLGCEEQAEETPQRAPPVTKKTPEPPPAPEPKKTSLPETRKPAAGRPLVYPIYLVKYPLFYDSHHTLNYLPVFIDRALRHDKATLPKKIRRTSYPSYLLDVQLARRYGVDGFAFALDHNFGWYGLPLFELTAKTGLADFGLVPMWGWGAPDPQSFKAKGIVLQKMLASKHAARINGKVLIGAVWGDSAGTPAKWKVALDELRARHGDTFLFVVDIVKYPVAMWKMRDYFHRHNGAVREEEVEKIKQYLRGYLDVCDGISLEYSIYVERTWDNKFYSRFYKKVLLPIYQSVLAEPKYRGKLLALSAINGYFNQKTDSWMDESGTKTLRESFEASMAANPDIIFLPEWNEHQENTFIQPSVAKGFSAQRIIKYYMHRLKKETPAPNPGDDLSIPNLIISYRRVLILGQPLEIELLNVPDSDQDEYYSARLTLKDIRGKVVKTFPQAEFAAREMRDKTYRIPSEDFSRHQVLIPSLTVTNSGGKTFVFEKGLRHIRLKPTWNWDYLWVKQPLRDLCRPTNSSFTLTREEAEGKPLLRFKGSFAGEEKIASVEVLENGNLIHAVDREKTYDREKEIILSISFSTLKPREIAGTMTLQDGQMRLPWKGKRYGTSPTGRTDAKLIGANIIQFKRNRIINWNYRSSFFVAIPKEYQDRAILKFDTNVFKKSIPLKTIVANGAYAITSDKAFTTLIEYYNNNLPAHPVHLDANAATFAFKHLPLNDHSVYHLRVITKSGKTYRSPPLLPGRKPGRRLPLNIFSYSEGRAITVEVDADRIPELTYDFSPRGGSLLLSTTARIWHGKLGFVEYNHPYRRTGLPEGFMHTAPRWVKEGGVDCLYFDGKTKYIMFPEEALPRGSFTLTFEIKPTSLKKQILFKHSGWYPGILTLWLENGKLLGAYNRELGPQDKAADGHKVELTPNLPVPPGQWSKIEIRYDLRNFVFTVNGKKSAPVPCNSRGFLFQPAAFGGHKLGQEWLWFEGYLKSFRISHYVRR